MGATGKARLRVGLVAYRTAIALAGVIAALLLGAAPSASAYTCDKTISSGSVQALVNSLSPGQVGCLRQGTYTGDYVTAYTDNITLAGYPGDPRPLVKEQLRINASASGVTVRRLQLDSSHSTDPISPYVAGSGAKFLNNVVTNHNTEICFLVVQGADGVQLRGNYIHGCGRLPSTNKDHGVYISADKALVVGNHIYHNVDRGIQLYPDADNAYVAGNTVDGNGEGIIISNTSDHNLIEHNTFTNSTIRHNAETDSLTGTGNIFRYNCFWQADDPGNPNISLPASVQKYGNVTADPLYVNPPSNLSLDSGSGCHAVYLSGTLSRSFPNLASNISDEFNGASLNTAKWDPTINGTQDPDVTTVGGGYLHLMGYCYENCGQTSGQKWDAAHILSRNDLTPPFYVVARAKVIGLRGVVTAPVWTVKPYAGEAGCAEIDVSEQYGNTSTRNNGTLHNHCTGAQPAGAPDCGVTLANGFHNYAAAVYSDRVEFYVDSPGNCATTITTAQADNLNLLTPQEFHASIYACQGWTGCPPANPPNIEALVDFIRVYTP